MDGHLCTMRSGTERYIRGLLYRPRKEESEGPGRTIGGHKVVREVTAGFLQVSGHGRQHLTGDLGSSMLQGVSGSSLARNPSRLCA